MSHGFKMVMSQCPKVVSQEMGESVGVLKGEGIDESVFRWVSQVVESLKGC